MTNNPQSLPGKVRSWLFSYLDESPTRTELLRLDGTSAQNEVVVNDGANDVDFRVEGDTVTNLIATDASSDAIGFYDTTPVAQSPLYTLSNVDSDRTYDADTVGVPELADVVGTLIADLKLLGLIQ